MTQATRDRLGGRYWLLWTTSATSNLADGLVKIALPLLVVAATDSPVAVATVSAALTLPWLILSLPAGALADRLDRRRVMLVANLVRGAVLGALALTLLTGHGTIGVLYAAALAAGSAEVLHDTAAQSIVPRLVPRALLGRANARLMAGELTANEFVGPPLGGALVALGAVVATAVPAALWLVAVGVLLLVRGSFRAEPGDPTTMRPTMRADIRDGLRLLWHQPVLRALSVLTAGFNFASAGVVAVLVLYAVGPDSALGLSASGYGLLLTASAAGSLLGSFVAAPAQERIGRTRTLALGMVASVLFLGGPALTTEPLAVGVAAAVGGAGIALVNVVAVTLRQQVTPDAKLGRVIGAHRLLAWGTKPLGAAAGGVLAELLGLRAVFVVMAALVLALLVLLRALSERALHAAEGGGPGTPPGVQMHVQTHEEGPSE